MVKTATRKYPMQYLKEWFVAGERARNAGLEGAEDRRGSCKALTAQVDIAGSQPEQVYAVGWADRKLKTIVANFGTTIRDSDSIRKRKV